VVFSRSPPSEGGVAAASADGVVSSGSPPSEGGVAAASADGVVNFNPKSKIEMGTLAG